MRIRAQNFKIKIVINKNDVRTIALMPVKKLCFSNDCSYFYYTCSYYIKSVKIENPLFVIEKQCCKSSLFVLINAKV